MEPIKALQMLYGATKQMTLTAGEHEQLKTAAIFLDGFITKKLKEEKEPVKEPVKET